jgi:hypothetical protein
MREPSVSEVLRDAIQAGLLRVNVAAIGRIETYDPETKTAEISFATSNPYNIGDDQVDFEKLPNLPNVPVVSMYGGGGFYVHVPLTQGDFVLVVFLHGDEGGWRTTGVPSDPDDLRRHSLSNPVAIPNVVSALQPFLPDPLAALARLTGLVMGYDGSPARIEFQTAGFTFGPDSLAISPILLAIPTLAYVATAAASATAGAVDGAANSAALTAIGAALTAIGLSLVPPSPPGPAGAAIAAAVTAIGAVVATSAASTAAAAAEAASAGVAAGAAPSVLVRSL